MGEERTLLLGIDFTDEYAMLSYINDEGKNVCVSFDDEQKHYRIPAAICASVQQGEWLFGESAMRAATVAGNVFADRFLTRLTTGEGVTVSGQEFTPVMMIECFFRLILRALQKVTGGRIIKGIVATCDRDEEPVLDGIRQAFGKLGIESDRLTIIGRSEAFTHFVISQNRNIWINDVGVLELKKNSCSFLKLSFVKNQEPVLAVAAREDVSDKLNYGMLSGDTEALLYNFKTTTTQLICKSPMSAVYFTGAGFDDNWADESLKGFVLADRRIFKGQNLFVTGAGKAAECIYNEGHERPRLIDEDGLQSSIAIRAYKDGSVEEVMVAQIGQSYKEAAKKLEVIMEDTNEIALIIHNVRKKDYKCSIMTLETMEERADKTVRMQLSLQYPDRNTCVVTVRDMGFGEIRDTNFRIWEQILKI